MARESPTTKHCSSSAPGKFDQPLTHRPLHPTAAAAAKADDEDPVIAEYDVFLTPPIAEPVYLLQYPNRPRNRPYSSRYGNSPYEMRIKPTSGFLEVDVQLNTEHNFNKYMGLKWGDASRTSKELHNSTGTYGPASGLHFAKPRSTTRSKDLKAQGDREMDFENDMRDFKSAVEDDKVFAKQTLGGQIIKHTSTDEKGNYLDNGRPNYFVGAFKDNQLTLTKITGTCQMRPHFHHLDAEEERSRLAASRAQADAAPPKTEDAKAQAVLQHTKEQEDKTTQEWKLRQTLKAAEAEHWIDLVYIDEEDEDAYTEFENTFKIDDVSRLPVLKSDMDDWDFLDAMSAPRSGESPTRRRKRASRKKKVEAGDDGDDADGEGEDGDIEA